jgi:hypothetical protein
MTDNIFTILGKPATRFKATHFLTVKGVPSVYGMTLNHKFRTTTPLSKVVASKAFMQMAHERCRATPDYDTDIQKHGAIVAPRYVHRLLAEHCTPAYNIKDWTWSGSPTQERAYYLADSNRLRILVHDGLLLIFAGPEGRDACLRFIEKEKVDG